MPKAQGKGVGRDLINEITAIATNQNNHTLLLNVYRNNPAIQFYQKIGFTKAGEEKIDVGNGFIMDDFVMDKRVS